MMMKEISLHVLDIIQNSITADASLVSVWVVVRHEKDWMSVSVEDDGKGMDEETLKRVISPFETSRTTRKVGLGIPMFKAGAEATGGAFQIRSALGKGTFIQAEYRVSHLDRPPLGDMAETMYTTVICHPEIDFFYRYIVDDQEYTFDTRIIRSILGPDIPLNHIDVSAYIRNELTEGIHAIYGGV